MNDLAPGWKGQPDDTEREDTPCDVCGGKGYLEDQGYGCADIPDGYVPVQRCDACQQFEDDGRAAQEYAAAQLAVWRPAPTGGALVMWFDGVADEEGKSGPGDWAVCILPGPADNQGAT